MASRWGGSFAHSLGTSARSKRQALSVCPLLHRSPRGDATNHHLVCVSLEYRGHLSTGSRSSWPRHPATLDYSCHCTNHSVSARLVQPGGPDGTHLASRVPADPTNGLVFQSRTHLCRCSRCGSPPSVDPVEFAIPTCSFGVGPFARSAPRHAHCSRLLRCLKWPKSSRMILLANY